MINLLVGFPGETDETVDESIAFLARNARWIDRVETVNPVYMMVASDLVRHPERFGIDLTDGATWTAQGVGFDKRTEWIYRLMDQVSRAGVPCQQAVHQDFSIVPEEV